jgi:ATP-binding cassette subfamily B protein
VKTIKILKRIWGLCAPYHWYIIGALALLLSQQTIVAVVPLIFGHIVTAVTKGDMHTFVLAISAWAVLACIRSGISYVREHIEIRKVDFDIMRHLSRVSMEKFFSISMGQHHLGHSVIKRNVISKGEAAIAGMVFMSIYDLIPTTFMILLPLGFLLVKAPVIGLCVLGAITCFLVYTFRYNMSFVPRLRQLDTSSNLVSKKQGEMIQNADVVFVNAQEERVRGECDEENAKQSNQSKPVWTSYLGWFYGGQWFISLSQAACIALAGYLTYKGEITTGMFVTIYMWIASALGTMSNISNVQRNLAKNMAPVGKYFKFLDYQPDIVMPSHPVPIEHFKGRIEFRHVNFTYRSRTEKDDLNDDTDEADSSKSDESKKIPALKDVSFVLEEGKLHAFVGKSGAGKSTLVGLMLRAFDPQNGHVLIDGVDIRMLDFRELRRNIGLVPQDVSLFDGTMRYNVTFGMNGSADKVTTGELDDIAKLSRISEFSDKLEKGWETLIGERGIKLSGGQRQRVGIARALIKNPHILIFDEATSSLDTENEARIRESIREASVGKTTIIIAHRLATVRDADKIFVFDEGKVVGTGTHDELLHTNEYYQRLVHNQVIMA